MINYSKDLIGVIACGGESSRMGHDKSSINYHGKPQKYFLYDLIKPLCEDVFISCSQKQSGEIEVGYNFITDKNEFANHGPVSGLLSAFSELAGKAVLFIGCDYPYLDLFSIEKLIQNRNFKLPVTYINSDNIPEPLISIYEKDSYSDLLKRFNQDKFSLRKYLELSEIVRIFPMREIFLKSVDTAKFPL